MPVVNDFLYCKIDKRVPGGAMQFWGLEAKNGRTSRVWQYLSYNGKKVNRSDDTYGFDEPLSDSGRIFVYEMLCCRFH
jgi:hypothetical protein